MKPITYIIPSKFKEVFDDEFKYYTSNFEPSDEDDFEYVRTVLVSVKPTTKGDFHMYELHIDNSNPNWIKYKKVLDEFVDTFIWANNIFNTSEKFNIDLEVYMGNHQTDTETDEKYSN